MKWTSGIDVRGDCETGREQQPEGTDGDISLNIRVPVRVETGEVQGK